MGLSPINALRLSPSAFNLRLTGKHGFRRFQKFWFDIGFYQRVIQAVVDKKLLYKAAF